MGEDLT